MKPILAGALLIVTAEFLFAAMGATIRHLSSELDNELMVFFRNCVGLMLLAPLMRPNSIAQLRTQVLHLHLLRAVSGVSAMYCFYYALANMPLAEAMLLKLSAPLFIPLIALVWLGESLSLVIIGAVALGFVGVAIILTPDFQGIAPTALIALSGGFFAAIAKVSVRRLGRTEPATRIVFYFALIAGLISAVPVAWLWQLPAPALWPWLLALGLFATLGQLAMTRGFSMAAAGRLAPFTYFSVIFGGLLGWLFWDEQISSSLVAGSLLIVSAGLLTGASRHRASA